MRSKIALLFSTLLFLSMPVACQNKAASLDKTVKQGKLLATKGDAKIYEGYLNLLTRVNPALASQIKTPSGKKRLVDSLLEQEVMYQESVKRGVPKKASAQEKAALYQRVIFGQALVDDVLDATAKDYYEKNKDTEFQQVKIAQIFIKKAPATPPRIVKPDEKAKTPPVTGLTDAEALKKGQEAKAKLDAGTPWDEVVKEFSDDVATKDKGGEMGPISKNDRRIQFLDYQELVNKAFSMKVGEISGPIAAKDGYHIIKVEEAATVVPYDQVETMLKFKLRSVVKNELMAQLTKDKKTEYLDPELQALAKPETPENEMMMQMGEGMEKMNKEPETKPMEKK